MPNLLDRLKAALADHHAIEREVGAMNEEYARHFGDHRPARAAVEVARLPKAVRVEIDAIAVTS